MFNSKQRLERWGSRRRVAIIVQYQIKWKKVEGITLLRCITYRALKASKSRKGRFTKIIRDVCGKKPKKFMNRRTKKVTALSFGENTLSFSFSMHLCSDSKQKNIDRKKDWLEKLFPNRHRIYQKKTNKQTKNTHTQKNRSHQIAVLFFLD